MQKKAANRGRTKAKEIPKPVARKRKSRRGANAATERARQRVEEVPKSESVCIFY